MMLDFLKFVSAAVGGAVVLTALTGFVVEQLVRRDQGKVEHNRRHTDKIAEQEQDVVHPSEVRPA